MTDKAVLTLTDDGEGGIHVSVEMSPRAEGAPAALSHVMMSQIVQNVILPIVAAARANEKEEDVANLAARH